MIPGQETSVPQVILSSTTNLIQGLVQNRINLINTILIGHFLSSEDYKVCSIISILPLLSTGFGQTTHYIYKKTLVHLQRHKRFDPRFFQMVIGHMSERRLLGYCQLQGMYLAAKRCGHEEEFFRLKREYTKNIAPNF